MGGTVKLAMFSQRHMAISPAYQYEPSILERGPIKSRHLIGARKSFIYVHIFMVMSNFDAEDKHRHKGLLDYNYSGVP